MPLRSSSGVSAVSQSASAERRSGLKSLLDAADGNHDNTGVRFRNVRVEDVQIIGEENGITYGQWKGGPAGSLNIEFDYRFAPNISLGSRAWMERAGKKWSWRLRDDFETRVARRGVRTNHGIDPEGRRQIIKTLDADTPVDDITVIMLQNNEGYGVNHVVEAAISGISNDDYQPWLASMIVEPERFSSIEFESVPGFWLFNSMIHEVGHVLGYSYFLHDSAPTYQRYFNQEDHTFEGPESVRANDGNPVPFQWLLDFSTTRTPVAPHTPGARVDYGHPGVCSSIMSYCSASDGRWHRETLPLIELDFAFLSDIGYEILSEDTASEPELYGWGAWASYSGWGVGVERTISYEDRENGFVHVRDHFRAGADAFGIPPATNLADNSALNGTATWSGSLLGVDLGQPMLPPVVGNAELLVNLSNLASVARFGDLTTYVENQPTPFRVPSLEYAVGVTGNSFSDADNRISGGFFGPAHEEMAGVLNDQRSTVNLLAGFGGKR